MHLPIVNAVINRTRQVVSIPLGVAEGVATRGMWANPVYQLRGRARSGGLAMRLGVSSGAAGAGQSGDVHIY